jgi:hypothetical protein
MEKLNDIDYSILKYYKEGYELSGFEKDYDNLYNLGYLNGDLELTKKAYDFIKNFKNWDEITPYKNNVVIHIKPTL